MRNLIIVVLIWSAFLEGMFLYGSFPRTQTDYMTLQPAELTRVLCVFESGDADTYYIPIPRLEGFSLEDKADLEEAWVQSYCDSIQ